MYRVQMLLRQLTPENRREGSLFGGAGGASHVQQEISPGMMTVLMQAGVPADVFLSDAAETYPLQAHMVKSVLSSAFDSLADAPPLHKLFDKAFDVDGKWVLLDHTPPGIFNGMYCGNFKPRRYILTVRLLKGFQPHGLERTMVLRPWHLQCFNKRGAVDLCRRVGDRAMPFLGVPFDVLWDPRTLSVGEEVDPTAGRAACSGPVRYSGCVDARPVITDFKRIAFAIGHGEFIRMVTRMAKSEPEPLQLRLQAMMMPPEEDEDD